MLLPPQETAFNSGDEASNNDKASEGDNEYHETDTEAADYILTELKRQIKQAMPRWLPEWPGKSGEC